MQGIPLELQIIYLVSLAIWGGLALRSIKSIIRITRNLYSMVFDLRNFTASDISTEVRDIPKQYTDMTSMLAGLGYMPFGAYRRAYRGLGDKVDSYVFYAAEKRGFARIWNTTPDMIALSFMTPFEDDSAILTEYPTGRSIETDRFIMDFTRSSILAAHERHQQRVQEWTAQGRTLTPLMDIDAYLAFLAFIYATYTQAFADPRFVRLTKVLLAANVICLLLQLAVVFVIVAWIARTPISSGVDTILVLAAIFAMFICGFISRRHIRTANNPTGAFDE